MTEGNKRLDENLVDKLEHVFRQTWHDNRKPCIDCGRFEIGIGDSGICLRCRDYKKYKNLQARFTADIALERTRTPVQNSYTENLMYDLLWELYAENMSLRQIAKELFKDKVTHMDIKRGLQGIFPKSDCKREAMLLEKVAPAPVCSACGIVHVKKCPHTITKSKMKYSYSTLKIRKDDMTSAAQSIKDNLDPENVKELIKKLTEEL